VLSFSSPEKCLESAECVRATIWTRRRLIGKSPAAEADVPDRDAVSRSLEAASPKLALNAAASALSLPAEPAF